MTNPHFYQSSPAAARVKFGATDMPGIPKRLLNYLHDNQVQYEILHRPEVSEGSEVKKSKNRMARFHVKVVMVKARHQHVLTVLPSNNGIDLEELGKILGEPVRFDTEEEFKWLFPDCAVDAIPPFGNLYGLPTLADSELSKNGYIVFTAGTPNDYMKLTYHTYERIVQPSRAAFSVKTGSRHSE